LFYFRRDQQNIFNTFAEEISNTEPFLTLIERTNSNSESFLTSVEMETSQPFLRSVEGLNEVLSMSQSQFMKASSSKSSFSPFDNEILSPKTYEINKSFGNKQSIKVK
jgi:hypothetical protein